MASRYLVFNVDKQKLTKASDCDFSNIVAGSSGYLFAKFEFSEEWDGCKKAASFWFGNDEHATVLKNDECLIPKEALVGRMFKVSVMGKSEDISINTNKITIRQGAK